MCATVSTPCDSLIDEGDDVARFIGANEETGETGYYIVTALIAHIDPSLIKVKIDGDPSRPTGPRSGTKTLATTDGAWLVHHCGDGIERNRTRKGMEKLERLFKNRNDAGNALSERYSGSRSR